jgi:hypothetical protein
MKWALDRGLNELARTLLLVDLKSGTSRRVSDAPYYGNNAPPVWIDGGKSVVIAGALESLRGADTSERVATLSRQAVLLLDPTSMAVRRIDSLDAKVAAVRSVSWDDASQTLTIAADSAERVALPPISLKRSGERWDVLPAGADIPQRPQLVVRQSMNSPPVLYATRTASSEDVRLLDPNPWLAEKQLGRVEEVSWQTKDGRTWRGGLYYPPGFKQGVRYPLLLQTHGFDPSLFSLRGKARIFPGQALAAFDMVVLQVQESERDVFGRPEWWDAMRAGYEGAIDYLVQRGLVDPNRVGIQGWSATGVMAGYTLTHSPYEFAAAAITATGDFGWLWYLGSGTSSEIEGFFGATPFGPGLDAWARYSPTFNMHRMNAPLFLWGERTSWALWDWYSGLSRLKKPVEYWVAPTTEHDPFQIGHQLALNGLLVDWFRFWLKGEEDSNPQKALQYVRWRELRSLSNSQRVMMPSTPLRPN